MSNVSEFIANSTTPRPSENAHEFKDYYYALAESIYFYGLSIIIPFGLVGNCVSIFVILLSPILRRTTTGQFLVALALADTAILVGDGIRWLATRRHSMPEYLFPQYLGLNFYDTSNAACTITNFLRYGGQLWSVWITIAIAVERLIVVAFPQKIGRLLTMNRTRISIVFIVAVSLGLGSFPFWTLHATYWNTFGVYMPRCVIYNWDAYQAWNNAVVKLGTLLIPGILIVILTVAIIVVFYRTRELRNVESDALTGQRSETTVRIVGLSLQTQMTIMLVAVCVSTIALRTPYTVAYYFRTRVWEADFVHPTADVQTYMAYKITDMINTINYAINFVLYCVWGRCFRKEAKRIFCRGTEATSDSLRLATDEVCLEDMRK